MLVSVALTAATVYMAFACTKRLDQMQWPETRPTGPRLRHIAPRQDTSVQDIEDFVRDVTEMIH